ncbi:MAG: dTDP-4-amino-4,6-dideoxygalactose transaminase [Chitinophagaceae bacterium]|nr:dTDP-4-amino-4,6-dideoxygalactose transaminase [Chitinophagaceae bacterium]
MSIPFNKPFLAGKELQYIQEAINSGKISGNGGFTGRCQSFFQQRYGFSKTLLTNSCTDALEMAAILLNIGPGDEVIVPNYTFVSTANAFVLRGATIVFCDSRPDHPGMNEELLEGLITEKTRAIIPVHYAGVACDMKRIMKLAKKYKLFVVEDAAHAIDSYYLDEGKRVPLGGIGHLAAFSFHETKNINCGEGGMLVVNDPTFEERAELIWEKGTNRSQFFRGEIDEYSWVDVGSSFLPSEISAAFLYGQLECLDRIQAKRKSLWEHYMKGLGRLEEGGILGLPKHPVYAQFNGHLFYIVCPDEGWRKGLMGYLKGLDILAVSHYRSLHDSPFQKGKPASGKEFPWSDHYTSRLLRLPLYYELELSQVDTIVSSILEYAGNR